MRPSLVRRGGTVSFFAGLPAETRVTFDAERLHYDEVRLIAPFHFTPADVRTAFDLIADARVAVAKAHLGRRIRSSVSAMRSRGSIPPAMR